MGRKSVVSYWQAGQALELAKEKVPHGEYEAWLDSFGIAHPTAKKARDLYKAVVNPKALAKFKNIFDAETFYKIRKSSKPASERTDFDTLTIAHQRLSEIVNKWRKLETVILGKSETEWIAFLSHMQKMLDEIRHRVSHPVQPIQTPSGKTPNIFDMGKASLPGGFTFGHATATPMGIWHGPT